MVIKKCWQYQIIFAVISIAVGGLSAILIRNQTSVYLTLDRPALAPPSWVFPVVWTILYILMGAGAGLVVSAPRYADKKAEAIGYYGIQLAANFFWTILFFNLQLYKASFAWLVLLLFLVFLMTQSFYRVSKWAGVIQIPYMLWLVFAGYLNLYIAIHN